MLFYVPTYIYSKIKCKSHKQKQKGIFLQREKESIIIHRPFYFAALLFMRSLMSLRVCSCKIRKKSCCWQKLFYEVSGAIQHHFDLNVCAFKASLRNVLLNVLFPTRWIVWLSQLLNLSWGGLALLMVCSSNIYITLFYLCTLVCTLPTWTVLHLGVVNLRLVTFSCYLRCRECWKVFLVAIPF
jgi:hypothetical protein